MDKIQYKPTTRELVTHIIGIGGTLLVIAGLGIAEFFKLPLPPEKVRLGLLFGPALTALLIANLGGRRIGR